MGSQNLRPMLSPARLIACGLALAACGSPARAREPAAAPKPPVVRGTSVVRGSPEPAPHPFESQITAFENWDRQNAFPKDPILFVGSSSIRLWQTAEAFPGAPVINRGFGGSTVADVNH